MYQQMRGWLEVQVFIEGCSRVSSRGIVVSPNIYNISDGPNINLFCSRSSVKTTFGVALKSCPSCLIIAIFS